MIVSGGLRDKKILDLGAGNGYLSMKLGNAMKNGGLDVKQALRAADIHPENFKYAEIKCEYGDFAGRLPFEDGYFDIVCFVEVIEHLEDQFGCIREIHRILKPGGTVYVTTPNVLNINSRIRYFMSGLFNQFNLLLHKGMPSVIDWSGHIHPISYVFLSNILKRGGFGDLTPNRDRSKRSAIAYAALLYPLIRIWGYFVFWRMRRSYPEIFAGNEDIVSNVNSFSMLTGRTLILSARKGLNSHS
ncbi:MAG: class I SAM-dependent methyltransferase [Planctomycetota bacterium]|nr:class I SAM-dependent methyltransferase [Planctomycetota bacterium]